MLKYRCTYKLLQYMSQSFNEQYHESLCIDDIITTTYPTLVYHDVVYLERHEQCIAQGWHIGSHVWVPNHISSKVTIELVSDGEQYCSITRTIQSDDQSDLLVHAYNHNREFSILDIDIESQLQLLEQFNLDATYQHNTIKTLFHNNEIISLDEANQMVTKNILSSYTIDHTASIQCSLQEALELGLFHQVY